MKYTKDNSENEKNRKNKPTLVKHAFLEDNGLVARIKNKLKIGRTIDQEGNTITIKKELKEPILLLMKDNGFMETIEDVKPGEFIMSTSVGEKSINLVPNRLTSWKYGGQVYKTWVAYENCMSPYPEDPIHNAEMYRKTTTKIALNYRDRDEAKLFEGKGKMWLLIIGGIAIAIIAIGSSPGVKEMLFGAAKTAAPAAKIAATTIKNNVTSAITVG